MIIKIREIGSCCHHLGNEYCIRKSTYLMASLSILAFITLIEAWPKFSGRSPSAMSGETPSTTTTASTSVKMRLSGHPRRPRPSSIATTGMMSMSASMYEKRNNNNSSNANTPTKSNFSGFEKSNAFSPSLSYLSVTYYLTWIFFLPKISLLFYILCFYIIHYYFMVRISGKIFLEFGY